MSSKCVVVLFFQVPRSVADTPFDMKHQSEKCHIDELHLVFYMFTFPLQGQVCVCVTEQEVRSESKRVCICSTCGYYILLFLVGVIKFILTTRVIPWSSFMSGAWTYSSQLPATDGPHIIEPRLVVSPGSSGR